MKTEFIAFCKWFSHAFSEKDPLDGDMRFSIGRSSFIAWFWVTLLISIKYTTTFALLPVYYWLLGFSLLGYVIGKEYLVLSFLQKNGNGNGHTEEPNADPK